MLQNIAVKRNYIKKKHMLLGTLQIFNWTDFKKILFFVFYSNFTQYVYAL